MTKIKMSKIIVLAIEAGTKSSLELFPNISPETILLMARWYYDRAKFSRLSFYLKYMLLRTKKDINE